MFALIGHGARCNWCTCDELVRELSVKDVARREAPLGKLNAQLITILEHGGVATQDLIGLQSDEVAEVGRACTNGDSTRP